jgi:tetratricopeptide (TPR) repeat protein
VRFFFARRAGVHARRGRLPFRSSGFIVCVRTPEKTMESKTTPSPRQLFLAGRFDEAVAAQRAVIAANPTVAGWAELAHYFFVKGEFSQAAEAYGSALALDPDNASIIINIGLCHTRNKAFDTAHEWLARALERSPGVPQIHDALPTLAATTGDRESARRHGRESLRLKDEQSLGAFVPFEVNRRPIPRFDPTARDKNIISFSLWGTHPMYLDNALRNVTQAREIFPEWRCRFYCEKTSVPAWTISELLSQGADVVLMDRQRLAFEGLFWRFRPVCDATLDRVLVRDVDSVVTYRERLAVNEWLASDRWFHVMRDSHTHTDLILAGLWGAVAGVLPPLADRIEAFMNGADKSKNADQRFLGANYWPEVRKSVLIHDSQFGNFDARDFPANSALDGPRHVGGFSPLERQFMSGRCTRETDADTIENTPRRRGFIFTLSPGYCGTARLADLLRLNAPQAEVYHERGEVGDLGLHYPDPGHTAMFNIAGNVPAVARFWLRKFNAIRYGDRPVYAETSHMLAMAGLMENLPLLGSDVEVHVIALNGPVEEVAWHVAGSMVFAHKWAARMEALDPAYPRNAVAAEPYRRHGIIGLALWYVREAAARAVAYQRLLAAAPNVRVHNIETAALADPTKVFALLTALGLTPPATLRPAPNSGEPAPLAQMPDSQRELLRHLLRAGANI